MAKTEEKVERVPAEAGARVKRLIIRPLRSAFTKTVEIKGGTTEVPGIREAAPAFSINFTSGKSLIWDSDGQNFSPKVLEYWGRPGTNPKERKEYVLALIKERIEQINEMSPDNAMFEFLSPDQAKSIHVTAATKEKALAMLEQAYKNPTDRVYKEFLDKVNEMAAQVKDATRVKQGGLRM